MIGLDTYVVRYLTQDDPDQAPVATSIFESLREDAPGYVATVVWAEAYWVLTPSYGFRRNEVVDRLAALSRADEIRAEDPAGVAAAPRSARHGADFANALINAAATQRVASRSTNVRQMDWDGDWPDAVARPEGFEPPTF